MMRRPLVALIGVALVLSACGGDSSGDAEDTRQTLESYIEACNNGDFDEVITHFSQESVIVGHPTDFDSEAADIGSIRRLHKEDLRFGEGYTISDVQVDGDTVTWDSVWGEDGCVDDHSAVVRDGVIFRWVWGDFVDCSELG